MTGPQTESSSVLHLLFYCLHWKMATRTNKRVWQQGRCVICQKMMITSSGAADLILCCSACIVKNACCMCGCCDGEAKTFCYECHKPVCVVSWCSDPCGNSKCPVAYVCCGDCQIADTDWQLEFGDSGPYFGSGLDIYCGVDCRAALPCK